MGGLDRFDIDRGRLPLLRDYAPAILAFVVMVAYWPGVPGAGTTLRWSVLWAMLPCLGIMLHPRTWGLLASFLLLLMTAGSLFLSNSPMDGVSTFLLIWTICVALWIGSSLKSLCLTFHLAAYGIGLSSAVAIVQWFGYQPVIALTPISGLFLNKNILAETASLVVVGCLVYRLWFTALLTVPAIILPMHRGSMIALAIAGMIWVFWKLHGRTFNVWLLPFVLLSSLGMATLGLHNIPASLSERLAIWHATYDGLTWFGHGPGSFAQLFAVYAAPYIDTIEHRPLHAHNDLLELTFEYGVFALVPAAFALFCLLARSPVRFVVLVFLIEGLVEFPLYMPATAFLAALCAGHLCRDGNRLRLGELWRRMALHGRVQPDATGLSKAGRSTVPV